MDCLNCPNYWGNTPNEEKCEQCANTKTFVDLVVEMPPLFEGKQILVGGYHLRQCPSMADSARAQRYAWVRG